MRVAESTAGEGLLQLLYLLKQADRVKRVGDLQKFLPHRGR
jgi:hypothetical protein